MGLCLRGRNEPLDIREEIEVQIIQGSTHLSKEVFEDLSQVNFTSSGYIGINNGTNPSESLMVIGNDIQPLVEVTQNEFYINGTDLIKIISYLHERFPDLKQYLEEGKNNEESTKSSVD